MAYQFSFSRGLPSDMFKLIRKTRSFVIGEDGTTAVEYAVILMLIAGAIITASQLVGYAASDYWQANNEEIGTALNQGNP